MRWILFCAWIFSTLFTENYAQLAGTVKKNEFPSFRVTEMGKTLDTALVLDANWRWVHNKGGYTNCYDANWNKQFCPDPVTCAQNCEVEGVDLKDYKDIYGVTSTGSAATLKYVTGGNVGSRLYILDESLKRYKGFNLVNRELVFDIDMSQLPCGLNGALYFVEMPLDGGLNTLNKAGAPYGVGYGDAQCPTDIKYINGFVNINNTGACSVEMDIWEANSRATAFTPHSCMINKQTMRGVYPCLNDVDCGRNANRYKGVCDKDGADFNPYRLGDSKLYGFGPEFAVDTSKPFSVVTQFHTADRTDNSDIVKMKRLYVQNGKTIDGGELTSDVIKEHKTKFNEVNHYEQLGGFRAMTESFRRGQTFVISIWDDSLSGANSMAWLDSVYPPKSTTPGSLRGPCDPNENRDTWSLRSKYPNAQYTLSNVKVQAISAISNPSPSPAPRPPAPVPSPSPVPRPPAPVPSPSPVPRPPAPTALSCNMRCAECTIELC